MGLPSVGRSQLRLAGGGGQEVHIAFGITKHHHPGLSPTHHSALGRAGFRCSRATSPLALPRHAAMRSLASAAKRRRSSSATALAPPTLRDHSRLAPCSASRRPPPLEGSRTDRSPTRTAGPTRSASRSTSFVPAGRCHRHFPLHRAGSRVHPDQTRTLPHQQRVAHAISTPGCARVSASPGRCSVHRRLPIQQVEGVDRAVHRHHEDPPTGHQGGSPRWRARAYARLRG
jgi:hypothetical protein